MNSESIKILQDKIDIQGKHIKEKLQRCENILAKTLKGQVRGINCYVTIRLQLNRVKVYLRDENIGKEDISFLLSNNNRYHIYGVEIGAMTYHFNCDRERNVLLIVTEIMKRPGEFARLIKVFTIEYADECKKLEHLEQKLETIKTDKDEK